MGAARPLRSESPAPTDSEAIARARVGDHEAFRVLVERYQGRVYRMALRVLGDEDMARDAVQDGFLKVYGSLDRFEGRSSFYTWLYRIVLNRCLDQKRRDRSGRHVEWAEEQAFDADPGAEAGGFDAAERADPTLALDRAETRAAVARAIASLPEDARRTLELREVDGLSYADIAKSLGIPKGTVMSRLHHARRRVRDALLASGELEAPGWAADGEGAA